jgi:hypothetical protein
MVFSPLTWQHVPSYLKFNPGHIWTIWNRPKFLRTRCILLLFGIGFNVVCLTSNLFLFEAPKFSERLTYLYIYWESRVRERESERERERGGQRESERERFRERESQTQIEKGNEKEIERESERERKRERKN